MSNIRVHLRVHLVMHSTHVGYLLLLHKDWRAVLAEIDEEFSSRKDASGRRNESNTETGDAAGISAAVSEQKSGSAELSTA